MREWWDGRWGMLGWGGSFRNHLLSAKGSNTDVRGHSCFPPSQFWGLIRFQRKLLTAAPVKLATLPG